MQSRREGEKKKEKKKSTVLFAENEVSRVFARKKQKALPVRTKHLNVTAYISCPDHRKRPSSTHQNNISEQSKREKVPKEEH